MANRAPGNDDHAQQQQQQQQFPSWLTAVRQDVVKTGQWQQLTRQLYAAIQDQLKESNTLFFTDLSERERAVFLNRAVCVF